MGVVLLVVSVLLVLEVSLFEFLAGVDAVEPGSACDDELATPAEGRFSCAGGGDLLEARGGGSVSVPSSMMKRSNPTGKVNDEKRGDQA